MNWLGKVFVVVIVILSLMFTGLAMGVYATHKNWQQMAEKLKSDLKKAQGENQRLVAEHNQKVEELGGCADFWRALALSLECVGSSFWFFAFLGLHDRILAI